MSFAWLTQDISALKVMWIDGLSVREIAERLGRGVTRCAVIGKVYRMKGLPGELPARVPGYRTSKRNDNDVKLKRKTIAAITLLRAPLKALRLLAPPDSAALVAIINLRTNQCNWPIGDPREPDFTFCNHDKLENKTYCEFHMQIAYRKCTPK